MATHLKRYKTVIDIDKFTSSIPPHVIEQLYTNTSQCFPQELEKSVKHYYLRLVNLLHNDLKRYTKASPNSVSHSTSRSSSTMAAVFKGPEYGFYFSMVTPEYTYAMANRWELFVMYEGSPTRGTIAASCLVHYDETTGIAELEEICVNIPGKKYCKKLITKVIEYIKKEQNISVITIYCENHNVPACKCYMSIFDASDMKSIQRSSYTVQQIKKDKTITRFVYTFRKL